MTSSRTVKTLAFLISAMTAVTFVLSLVEPWTLSLQPRPARAGQLPPALSAVRQPWQSVELVLVPEAAGEPVRLPQAHVIVRADGSIETTPLWDAGQPLPSQVLRVCAVYQGQPADAVLAKWLATCDEASDHFGADLKTIRLKTLPQANSDAGQARTLSGIQRRINAMLQSR